MSPTTSTRTPASFRTSTLRRDLWPETGPMDFRCFRIRYVPEGYGLHRFWRTPERERFLSRLENSRQSCFGPLQGTAYVPINVCYLARRALKGQRGGTPWVPRAEKAVIA